MNTTNIPGDNGDVKASGLNGTLHGQRAGFVDGEYIGEQPPDLTEEDEAILDRVWARIFPRRPRRPQPRPDNTDAA